ncbi:MAG: AIPR family protein [Lachnospiraceae bacterium]
MNQIIKSYLDTHIKEYSLQEYEPQSAFEHFVNKCVVNRYTTERFDPSEVMTDKGEIGIDGVAIILNGQLVSDLEGCRAVFDQKRKVTTEFIFIQSKTSESFDGGEINTFFKGIKHFFENEEERPNTNEKMEKLIEIKDYIYSQSIGQSIKPALEMYYVCCGKWNEDNNLSNNIATDVRFFKDTGDFSSVKFYPYDKDKVITMYTEMRRKISRTFVMEKRLPFYKMEGIKQAYFGLIKCKDVANLLTDDQEKLFNNIFEDNVRDFQGYNSVNTEIRDAIIDKENQDRFSVLNNGITIVAKDIQTEGDNITIFDYQIVNGCQTSRVIFDNKEHLLEGSSVLAKIVQVDDDEVLDKIVYTSNRQTEVKYEAFSSANRFHKMLQEYYNSVDINYRLYYERRSKQYDMDHFIDKNKVVTLAGQTFAYISMFLNEPHSVNRYYGELLEAYKKRVYGRDDFVEPYYIAAYYVYYIDTAIKKKQIGKEFKHFKYHIICSIRALTCNAKVCWGNSRELRNQATKLDELLHDSVKLNRIINTACTCIRQTVEESPDISDDIIFRSKEFTIRMLKNIQKYSESKRNEEHLCVGQVVSCQVTAIKPYTIEVELRTDDERKYGSIHISNIANRYIQNISNEVSLGEILQAKIIDGYDEKQNVRGWDLSLILE